MTALKAVEGEGLDAWRRKLAELLDGDHWTLSDALLEMYPPDRYGDGGSRNTGLYSALLGDVEYLRGELGITTTPGYLGTLRSTAIAWPPSARALGVGFDVHKRMRGKDRHAEMQKRLRQAKREGFALNRNMLARYRSEENKTPPRPYQVRMRNAITAAVRREMLSGIDTKRPDWWMAAGEGDRDVAVQELRALASAIARGEK